MNVYHGVCLVLLLSCAASSDPAFSSMPVLLRDARIIAGENPYDTASALVFQNALSESGIPATFGDDVGGPLVLVGGPAVNPATKRYCEMFGIALSEEGGRVTIEASGRRVSHLTSSKDEDIAIAYLGVEEGRAVLLLWGYGRKGTAAVSLVLSGKRSWGNDNLCLLVWKDANADGIVSRGEVSTDAAGEEPASTIRVTLVIDYGQTQERRSVSLGPGSTVLDLLRQETQVDYTVYPFGVFVTSINGLANDATRGYYWLYWVNGRYATMSAGACVLLDGDVVEWKYSKP